MKITKEDALILTKALHQQVQFEGAAGGEDFQANLQELVERLDQYLVSDEECDDYCEEEEDDEEAEDDGEETEDSSSEEDEEDDEESGEDEESSEEDDDEEDLEADCTVDGLELHDLKAAKSGHNSVEFEHIEQPASCQVDLLVDGLTELEDVTHIRRKSKELHVRSADGEWVVYEVERFPKGWADALPLNELTEVSA